MNRLRRTSAVDATSLGSWTGGAHVRSVHAREPLDLRFMIYDLRFESDAFGGMLLSAFISVHRWFHRSSFAFVQQLKR
jgi:hypothetical protein